VWVAWEGMWWILPERREDVDGVGCCWFRLGSAARALGEMEGRFETWGERRWRGLGCFGVRGEVMNVLGLL